MTPTLAEYFRDLVEYGFDEIAVPHTVSEEFDRFRDVMVADRTVQWLHELLSEAYDAHHEEQAGATLHLLHNVTDQMIDRFSVTDEKTHDSTEFETGSWLDGRLAILDLAYFNPLRRNFLTGLHR